MTQLFDTTPYENPSEDLGEQAQLEAAPEPTRHLSVVRSQPSPFLARLDPETIEVGKRGIARARAMLREAAARREQQQPVQAA